MAIGQGTHPFALRTKITANATAVIIIFSAGGVTGDGQGKRAENEGADPLGSAPADRDPRSGAGNRSGVYRNRALIVPKLTVSSLTEQLTMGSPSSNGSNVYTPQASWMMPVALL